MVTRIVISRVSMLREVQNGVILYFRTTIWPGRRRPAGNIRRDARRPLRPRVSSCFELAAVLVSARATSVDSISLEVISSSKAGSSWLDWTAGVSVTLRRGSSGDLLITGGNGDFVVVFGCTCSRLRLRSLFRGFDVVARAGGLVSAGAWGTEKWLWWVEFRIKEIIEIIKNKKRNYFSQFAVSNFSVYRNLVETTICNFQILLSLEFLEKNKLQLKNTFKSKQISQI